MRELIKAELNKDITQRELANRVHVSQGTIQKILFTETKFTHETKKKIADYFKVPVSQFYDGIAGQGDVTAASAPSNPGDQITLRDILTLHEEIHKLATEIGDIKTRMIDAAQTGDLKRLGIVGGKG